MNYPISVGSSSFLMGSSVATGGAMTGQAMTTQMLMAFKDAFP